MNDNTCKGDVFFHWGGTVKRRKSVVLLLLIALFYCNVLPHVAAADQGSADTRPNILLVVADDWGWPHAGAYGDAVVPTPAFDRLAREGALLHHAYCATPSCTPSRGTILTGQWPWRLGAGANLWSIFPDRLVSYVELLHESGYVVGSTGKAWGPGRTETRGRALAGPRHASFRHFLDAWSSEQPFCFWLGSIDPHRPYEAGIGVVDGIDAASIQLPACLPNAEVVRGDVADYYWHVGRFDRLLADAVAALEESDQLERTLIVVTSDHGMPFPRGKGNLYDTGTRVPLAIRWPGRIAPGTEVEVFVSLADLAPTFLEVAGVEPPREMTGCSFLNLLDEGRPLSVPEERTYVVFGKERHVPAQEVPDRGGYPCRGIRTKDFLYLVNYRPDRWPAGTPHWRQATIPGAWLADCDNGPTKSWLVEHRTDNDQLARLYRLAFDKRPACELYDLTRDPDQLENVADEARYQAIQAQLHTRLLSVMRATEDPRASDAGEDFDRYEYLGGAPKHEDWQAGAVQ